MSDHLDKLADDEAFIAELRYTEHLMELEGEARNNRSNDVSVEWLLMKSTLDEMKEISDTLDKLVCQVLKTDEFLRIPVMELHGVYEAVLMIPDEEERTQVMELILLEVRYKSLPKRKLSDIIPNGVPVKEKLSGLRPESIWNLQKHLIVEKPFDKAAEAIFERALPSHKSQKYIDIAKSKNVWQAVYEAPIEHREQLCARLLKLYDIKAPEITPNQKRYINEGPKKLRHDRVLVIDKAGNAWTWSCGWFRVGEDGQKLDEKPVMGHAAFKRCIRPADPEDFARTSFRYTRPWGQWRKGVGPVYHALFGNGQLILTDGMHAVVEFADGVKREVILENLQSISEKTARRPPQTTEKKPRAKKAEVQMDLEQLMRML